MKEELSDLFETMRLFCICHGLEFDKETKQEVEQIREAIKNYEENKEEQGG